MNEGETTAQASTFGVVRMFLDVDFMIRFMGAQKAPRVPAKPLDPAWWLGAESSYSDCSRSDRPLNLSHEELPFREKKALAALGFPLRVSSRFPQGFLREITLRGPARKGRRTWVNSHVFTTAPWHVTRQGWGSDFVLVANAPEGLSKSESGSG